MVPGQTGQTNRISSMISRTRATAAITATIRVYFMRVPFRRYPTHMSTPDPSIAAADALAYIENLSVAEASALALRLAKANCPWLRAAHRADNLRRIVIGRFDVPYNGHPYPSIAVSMVAQPIGTEPGRAVLVHLHVRPGTSRWAVEIAEPLPGKLPYIPWHLFRGDHDGPINAINGEIRPSPPEPRKATQAGRATKATEAPDHVIERAPARRGWLRSLRNWAASWLRRLAARIDPVDG